MAYRTTLVFTDKDSVPTDSGALRFKCFLDPAGAPRVRSLAASRTALMFSTPQNSGAVGPAYTLVNVKLSRFGCEAAMECVSPSCAREETPESRGKPCLFLNTERGFGGKPPQKSGFRRLVAERVARRRYLLPDVC